MTIEASCHCGAVRVLLTRPPATVTDCNCSICRRLGVLWAYYPPEEVEILAAANATRAYVRGVASLEFHHCQVCGCVTHWAPLENRRPDRMGVNARLMPSEVLAAARLRRLDGAVSELYIDEP
jgi:hypothetical protein